MCIIRSLLDTDAYKLSMMKAVLRYCPGVPVRYIFNNRRPEGKFNDLFIYEFFRQLEEMANLEVTSDELGWLNKQCPWLGAEFLQYFKNYRFNPEEIEAKIEDGEFRLEIKGPWERTILWEVPLMAIISELFFLHCDKNWKFIIPEQIDKNFKKGDVLKDCHFADFGTRRRRNYEAQNLVVQCLVNRPNFFGTSNVHLAHKYKTRPVGTMAHEWIMGISALEGLRHANRYALKIWSKVFEGDLGIALTDTFGSHAFFEDFDGYLARLFDGVRHDSGDPLVFLLKTVDHYKELDIDPMTKMVVFSDGLDAQSAKNINQKCKNIIRCSFGIGTSLTNDFDGSKPLNMVIKMADCNGIPVVKLSDTPAKAIGDTDALRVAKWTFYKTSLDEK